ncbi:hypothetical protein BC826DRAFT_137303 [Russula brevipes]|nr:hypothetical protein BC826DRAFT_137303 [Russula brevipes]
MSQASLPTMSSNYQVIFDNALETYRKRTNEDLRSHPLFTRLESCQSPDAILAVLREQLPALDQPGGCNDRLAKLLDPTVKVLYAYSTTIGGGISLAYPPAGVIFTGIGILISAVIAVGASQDTLVELFERIENFFVRLETYTEVRPTAGMMHIVVKIMTQVLSVLAIAKEDVEQSAPKRFFKKLLGRTDIEKSLWALDKLTQEEARMASAECLMAAERVNKRVKRVGSDVQSVGEDVQGVDERVKGVDDRIKGVDDRVKDVKYKVKGVDNRVRDVEDSVKGVADGVKGVGDRVIDGALAMFEYLFIFF